MSAPKSAPRPRALSLLGRRGTSLRGGTGGSGWIAYAHGRAAAHLAYGMRTLVPELGRAMKGVALGATPPTGPPPGVLLSAGKLPVGPEVGGALR